MFVTSQLSGKKRLKLIKILLFLSVLLSNTAYAYDYTWVVESASVTAGGLGYPNQVLHTGWTFDNCTGQVSGTTDITLTTYTQAYTLTVRKYYINLITGEQSTPSTQIYDYWAAQGVTVSMTGDCLLPEEPCETEKANIIAQCGGEQYVRWDEWVEETCSGATCCPSGQFIVGGNQCIPECPYINNRTPGTLNNYGAGLCSDPECGPGETEIDGKCVQNCIPPEIIDLTNGSCYLPVKDCGPCETQVGTDCVAAEVCPSETYRNKVTCECTDNEPPACGMGLHWNGASCVDDEITRCPDGATKNQDGDCVQNPTAEPTPVPDPLKTPEENALPYLEALKRDAATQINQANDANEYLSNINENIQTSVGNQKVISGQLNNITEGIGGVIDAINTLGDGLDNDVDFSTLSTNDTIPQAPEFSTELEEGKNYSEYDNSEQQAKDKVLLDWAKQSTINPDSPFQGAITASGGACINGTIAGHAVQACFDEPWMLEGYAIMKLCMIALGYIQTAMLLNRAIAG